MADANIIVKIVDQTQNGINAITRQVDNVERSVNRTNTAFGGLNRAVGAFVAAVGAREIIQFANTVQNLNNRLKLVTGSQAELNDTFEGLLRIANRSRSDLTGVVDLYTRIQLATQDLGISTETAARVTESLGKLFAISGASAEGASAAIFQLGQGLGAGALRGEEFNSVVEQAPGILDVLAKKLGVSRGEVRELAADGALTAQVLIEALTESADTIDEQFSRTTATVGQALTVLRNNFIDLGRNGTPVFDALAEAILFLAENLETAITFAGTFIAAFAAAKIAAIVASIGSITAAVRALNLAIAANPIGLIATAVATAATLIIMHWDDIKQAGVDAFRFIKESYDRFENTIVRGWQNIKLQGLELWTEIQKGYLTFESAIIKGFEGLINTVVGGFIEFKNSIVAQFKAIAAAASDPLNALEAYDTALAAAREELAATETNVVDFSAAVAENDQRIQELNAELETERQRLDEASRALDTGTGRLGVYDDAILRATYSTEGATDATETNTQALGDNTGETDANTTATQANADATETQAQALARAEQEILNNIAAYSAETAQLGLSETQRLQLAEVIKNENLIREALGDTVEELSNEEIRLLAESIKANEVHTNEFLQLTDDRIDAIMDAVAEHERSVQEYEDGEREVQDIAEETTRVIEDLARQREDFLRDVNREIENIERETMTEIERLNQDKEDFIREAEEQGLLDHEDVMERIALFDQQIRDEQTRILEDALAEQRRLEERAERERMQALERENRERERAIQAHQREVERFTESSERELTRIRRASMDEATRIEDEKQEYIREARELGVLNHQSTQDRIRAYDQEIADARIEMEERVTRERARLADEQISKYRTIYDDMESKLLDFVGISESKFTKINEYAELFLGVNIRDIIRGTFAQGTLAIENFRKTGEFNLEGFGGFFQNIFGFEGNGIGAIISSAFDGSIFEGFVNAGKNILGGLTNIVSGIFTGGGNSIMNIISSVFDGNIFKNFVNTGKNILGGLGDAISGIFSGGSSNPISNIVNTVSNVVSGITGGSSTSASNSYPSGMYYGLYSNGSYTQNTYEGLIRQGFSPSNIVKNRPGRPGGSSVSSSIGSGSATTGISNVINTVSNIGNTIDNIISGIGDFFGFDNGGYIPSGRSGIVGERGAELVRGPASVVSRRDTAAMMGAVNVNFTINAVDSKDLDRVLIEKQNLIKNIVTTAVNQRGRAI